MSRILRLIFLTSGLDLHAICLDMKNLLLLFSLIICGTTIAQSWKDVGIYQQFSTMMIDHEIVITKSGLPYVAYIDGNNDSYIQKWDGLNWNPISSPVGSFCQDLEFIEKDDTLYFGVNTISNSYEVHMFANGSWAPLGIASLTAIPYQIGSASLSIDENTGKLTLGTTRTVCCINTGAQSEVYRWNGTTWTTHGNTDFVNMTGDPDVFENVTLSNGNYSYFFSNQYDFGGAMPVKPGNGNGPGGILNDRDNSGNGDVRLFAIDESAPSTWNVIQNGGDDWISDFPYNIQMDGNTDKDPFFGFVSDSNYAYMVSGRPNGLSGFNFETKFLAAGDIQDFDLKVLNSDSAIFLYNETPQGPPNIHVMVEDGGTWAELGTGVHPADLQQVELAISYYTNKPYVFYFNGQGGVRVWNEAPVFASNSTIHPICENALNFTAIDSLHFTDADNDSLWIFGTSQNQSLVQDANLTFTRLNAFDPASANNYFSLTLSAESNVTGSSNIEVYATDGLDTTLVQLIPFSIVSPTTATITLPSNDICINENTKILDQYGSPAGGTFGGVGVYGNKLYPVQIAPGVYPLEYIYQDVNGCLDTTVQNINLHDIPVVSMFKNDAQCGMTDGYVTASTTNGTPPYTFYWSSGATTESVTGLAPNMYYMNVWDAQGCYIMEAVNISSTGLSISGAVSDVDCFGDTDGAIDLTVSGTAPYKFYWSNGADVEDISGLGAGQYEVFVEDATGCLAMAGFQVTGPSELNANFSKVAATCGFTDGSLTTSIGGGTPPLNYQWYDYLAAPIGTNLPTLATIGAGQYGVTVTDNLGCTASFNSVLGEAGGPVVIPVSVTEASCANDGAIDMSINTPFGVQSISWNTGQTTEDISSLASGFYAISVTDNMGCIGMSSVNLNPELPTTTEICLVTVDTATNTNLIVWEKPASTTIDHFKIYRESSVAGVFQYVDQVPYALESRYTDTIAYPQLRSWRYKIVTVNDCGIESLPSPIHKTIHRVVNNPTPGIYEINWDEYSGFVYPTFFVWRYTDLNGWEEIHQEAFGGSYQYIDTPPSEINLDYIVYVQPPSTCTSSLKATDYNSSRSNKKYGTFFPDDDDSGLDESNILVQIYPNPSDGLYQITVNGISAFDLDVYDLSGKLIISANSIHKNYNLDLTDFAAGSYFIKVQSEQITINKQLIKK